MIKLIEPYYKALGNQRRIKHITHHSTFSVTDNKFKLAFETFCHSHIKQSWIIIKQWHWLFFFPHLSSCGQVSTFCPVRHLVKSVLKLSSQMFSFPLRSIMKRETLFPSKPLCLLPSLPPHSCLGVYLWYLELPSSFWELETAFLDMAELKDWKMPGNFITSLNSKTTTSIYI